MRIVHSLIHLIHLEDESAAGDFYNSTVWREPGDTSAWVSQTQPVLLGNRSVIFFIIQWIPTKGGLSINWDEDQLQWIKGLGRV